jgi:MerR family transcriptional regulator/heat shock protein HspR
MTNRTKITIAVAAQQTGLSPRTVRRYIRRGLIGETLTEDELFVLRRIRRLTDLGVNLSGVEVILHMRHQIEALQAELAWLRAVKDVHRHELVLLSEKEDID